MFKMLFNLPHISMLPYLPFPSPCVFDPFIFQPHILHLSIPYIRYHVHTLWVATNLAE